MATSPASRRVVSVLPSATELLCLIGGAPLLVGRSHEDNYPPCITDRPVLTGQKTSTEWTSAAEIDAQVSEFLQQGQSLYTLDEALVQSLQPDVILTQDLCAVCAIDLDTVRRVARNIIPKPDVVSLNPQGLQDVVESVAVVADAVGMPEAGRAAQLRLESRIAAAVAEVGSGKPRKNVAFIEWSDPIYVGGHWTPEMIRMAGGTHPLNPPGTDGGGAGKSFAVADTAVVESDPDVIIVCPCGLKLPEAKRETDNLYSKEWFASLRAVKAGNVYVVDGDAMFNRPGPRLVDALEWLVSLLQDKPHLCPDGFPVERYDASAHKAEAKPVELPDIETLHEAACAKGETTYADPATGYTVMSAFGLKKRGFCCGHRCRHCPYGHFNVAPERRINQLKEAMYIPVEGERKLGAQGVDVLFWSGGKDSFLTLLRHDRQRKVVMCTTFDSESGMIAHQGVHHHEIMNQAKKLKVDLVLAPLPKNHTNEEYLQVVEHAVRLAAKGQDDVRCLFGDLHLSDIRNWREKHHPFPCVFPIFGVPYAELQELLFSQDVEITVSASSHAAAPVGTPFTRELVASLPEGVDAMGERGEFHTLVKML